MKSLLINSNPVVSRLLELCTREKGVHLDEVKLVSLIEKSTYDILFVDIDSYDESMAKLLEDKSIFKKVLFSSDGKTVDGFDVTIEKPFLPLQVIKIIDGFKDEISNPSAQTNSEESLEDLISESIALDKIVDVKKDAEEEDILSLLDDKDNTSDEILDSTEIEKIKALLAMADMDVDEDEVVLNEDEYEKRKVEAIKEQLMADGLEIVNEDDMLDELSAKDVVYDNLDTDTLLVKNDDEVKVKKSKKKKSKKEKEKKNTKKSSKKEKREKKSKKKKIKFTQNDLERIEDAVEVAIATLDKKQMRKLLKGKQITVPVQLEDI
jgi:hypothetical protein